MPRAAPRTKGELFDNLNTWWASPQIGLKEILLPLSSVRPCYFMHLGKNSLNGSSLFLSIVLTFSCLQAIFRILSDIDYCYVTV